MIQNGKCAFSAQFESSEIVALKRISILFRNCLQPFLPRRHVHSEDYALARCPSTFQLQQFPEYQGVPHLHQGPCAATRHLSEIFFIPKASTLPYQMVFLILTFQLQQFSRYQRCPKFILGGPCTPGQNFILRSSTLPYLMLFLISTF